MRFLIVPHNRAGLLAITELDTSGENKLVIHRTFSINEVSDAFRSVVEGRVKGKVVISMDIV